MVFEQTYLLPQLKPGVIISNENGIYKLPHKLFNGTKFSVLEN